MDQDQIHKQFRGLGIAKIEYFKQISSTNDAAEKWLISGSTGRYLAFADEQTAGRGRDGRKWESPPYSALAFSLAFSKGHIPIEEFALVNGYVSVAICKALESQFNLEPKIKWPNDILLNGKKLAGILTEAKWQANQLQHLIMGIGINVASSSIAASNQFRYPATYLNDWLGKPLNRNKLLRNIVESIFDELNLHNKPKLIEDWESRLAFMKQKVVFQGSQGNRVFAKLIGLDKNGQIRLQDESGKDIKFTAGEIRMRPTDEPDNN